MLDIVRLVAILGKVQVVLTNDDGIDAPGIQALEQACEEFNPVVVAPELSHSSMSHHINTENVIEVKQQGKQRFRVRAGPADCARLAKMHLAPQADWLIAGINRGGNLGMDVCYSGTVAAAREAALLGWPAIAISQLIVRGRELDWGLAAARAGRVIRVIAKLAVAPGQYWNVNLPHLEPESAEPELVFCKLDTNPLPVRYRVEGDGYHYSGYYPDRLRFPGLDVDLCFSGKITATRMRPGF